MKRIYAFTLESDDVPSEKFGFNLRLIAYLMYDYVYNYVGENSAVLNINKNIVYNRILEVSRNEFYLESDFYYNKYINYEPFIIGDKTFAFTVFDGEISEEVLCKLLQQVLRLVGVNYRYVVNTGCYVCKDNSDEKNRRNAINLLAKNIGCSLVKKKSFAKKRILNNNMKVSFGGR